MILEAAVFYLAGAGSMVALDIYRRVRGKRKKDEPELPPSMKWSWVERQIGFLTKKKGFVCPTCKEFGANSTQPDLCECYEWPRSHFHFECKGCSYASIMRTPNDPLDQPKPQRKRLWRTV